MVFYYDTIVNSGLSFWPQYENCVNLTNVLILEIDGFANELKVGLESTESSELSISSWKKIVKL